MAISKNTKNNYKGSNAAYNESNDVKNARNNLIAMQGQAPAYQNSYANQLKDIYSKIQNGQDFNYNPDNDVAFRRFADEYNALSGLAIAGNQQQAQDLTGGYGSTYAPEVANQGLANMQANVNNAQPYFMEMAQEAYKADNDRLNNAYGAAASARDDELAQFTKQADAYNDKSKFAQQQYSDERSFDYNKYNDNRNFWANQYEFEQQSDNFNKELAQTDKQNEREYKLNSYSTYEKLASAKCTKYGDNKNNKGMKAYLKGLVKSGKITQYMADNLYDQYKYTAPKSSGGGGKGRGKGGGGKSGNGYYGTDPSEIFEGTDDTDDFIYSHSSIVNRRVNLKSINADIKSYYENGKLTAEEAAYLKQYYEKYGIETQPKKQKKQK